MQQSSMCFLSCSYLLRSQTLDKREHLQIDTLCHKLKWGNCTPVNCAKYNTMQNKVIYLLRESKRSFLMINQADAKEFWKTMNHDSSTLPTLQDRGINIDSSIDKVNVLNHFFILQSTIF